ncbi:aminotransferase class I/II-fold pyridoxal phosphate-dependent enzyme [Solwaraspora sp. WMMD1047]|uniref:aminotransferase class I/II-fold pyridoxal phosphate-dependent enzyme n=1 Tax=Solwaraspora sp. WMMD1047 TaxID=3016102 RepID=UPI002415A364|nr:aminotransferase class I/II-fold pyridoxal phosphate-dependent enzyme [Solwaraspora sp. WMMD1047]MDG4830100.1 aminotransferase class I/II-fold pyridoxal phosphate-dependent enzyme [Solwaraspora sp. WMMD1047]
MLQLIADAVDDRSARGIAAAVSRLVHAGQLPAGARLPTVRSVAQQLGISPTTVSEAWRSLAAAGAIETRGRSGTFVRIPARPREQLRYARLAAQPAALPTDLSTGVPDHDLLPDLTEALHRVRDARLTTSYLDEPVLPELESVLRQRWPFPPARLTVVDGALDALDRITTTVVRLGDRVIVENPTFPPMLDLLESAGAIPVPVPLDAAGLVPGALAEALDDRVVAVYLQPRAQNPTGVSMTPARSEELAGVLAQHSDVIVVEDDHAGDIATAPAVSVGTHLPERTVRVHSFSKSHGPDLRLAAVAGAAPVLTSIADRRLLGPGWSSRLLQLILLDLLTDAATATVVAHAATAYAHRRQALVTALAARGAVATADDGINLWLSVGNQQLAMLSLAARGIAVAPGAPFEAGPLGADHVRVTAGLVRADFDALATVLAEAAGVTARGSGRRSFPLQRGTR